ncbi:NOT2-3-5 domain-containing protein [Aphelenchoides fujianensis]|nr:NOT2-3-5 domain-containing protein [Aphelenchoides fujianensis]
MRTSSMSSGTLLASRAPPPQQPTPNSVGSSPGQARCWVRASFALLCPRRVQVRTMGIVRPRCSTPPSCPPPCSTTIGARRPCRSSCRPARSPSRHSPSRRNDLRRAAQVASSPLQPVGRMGGFHALDSTNAIINESEFPSLNRSSPISSHSSTPMFNNAALNLPNMFLQQKEAAMSPFQNHRMPYATLMRGVGDGSGFAPASEFSLQSEDFPALPGAVQQQQQQAGLGAIGVSSGQLIGADAQMVNASLAAFAQPLQFPNASLLNGTGGGNENGKNAKTGIKTHEDGSVSNIPPGLLCDQYGMAGLVSFIRSADQSPGLVQISLGMDISKLGLKFPQTERTLHQTFAGPWSDAPCNPKDSEVRVPDEYLTNQFIRDKLPPVKMGKLSEDLLFYIFYNSPGQVYQLAAAAELYQRDWRYHMTKHVWVTRNPFCTAKELNNDYELGSYHIFDPVQWRKIPQEMKLEFKQLEGRPTPAGFFASLNSGGGPTPTAAAAAEGFLSSQQTPQMAPHFSNKTV